MTSKNAKENDKVVSINIKTKNISRGGYRNDVNPTHGSNRFEQTFYSPING